jgi:hypothetical protein
VTTSAFAVAWAGAAPPAGYVHDVQVLRPGATAYADLAHGTTLTALTFTADAGPGPYGFRARLRNAATGKASGWSGTKTVTAA